MFRVAGLAFSGQVNYRAGGDARAIAVVVPASTTETNLAMMRDAELLEVLDQHQEVIGAYRLTGWRRIEKVYGGIQIMWSTISTDEVDALNEQIESLKARNATLEQANTDLEDALLELAALIGGEEEPEETLSEEEDDEGNG